MFEGRFVAELKAQNNAIQSHKIITFQELTDKELVNQNKNTEADTVLIRAG
jgi:hypothetical protein